MDNQLKIAIIEDDKFISKAYADALKRAGIDVMLINDPENYHTYLTQTPVHLILLDLIMPTKDGFEILQELKTDSEFHTIPVIIMSNLGQDADISRAHELGVAAYFVKANISIKEVIAKVKEILNLG